MESPLLVTRRGIEITDYVIISGEVNGVKADLPGFSFWLTHHYNLRSRLSRMTVRRQCQFLTGDWDYCRQIH